MLNKTLLPKHLKLLDDIYIERESIYYQKIEPIKKQIRVDQAIDTIDEQFLGVADFEDKSKYKEALKNIYKQYQNPTELKLEIQKWFNEIDEPKLDEIKETSNLFLSSLEESEFDYLLVKKFNSYDLMKIIQKSILAGEYINSPAKILYKEYSDNCLFLLDSILKRIPSLYETIGLIESHEFKFLTKIEIFNIKSELKEEFEFLPLSINAFKRIFEAILNNHQIEITKNHFQPFIPVEEILYIVSKYPLSNTDNIINQEIILCKLYISIYLSEVDLYPSTVENVIHILERFAIFIENHKGIELKTDLNDEVSEVILEKINFLLFKINLRKVKDKYRFQNEDSIYKTEPININSNEIKKFKIFSDLIKKTDNHYCQPYYNLQHCTIDVLKVINREDFEGMLQDNFIENLHHLSKYYLKRKELENLEILLNKVKLFRNHIANENNLDCQTNKAWKYIHNLIQNKVWKLKIEKLDKTKLVSSFITNGVADLNEIVEEIKCQQSFDFIGIKDFFPYLMLLTYMDELLEFMRRDAKNFISEDYRKDISDNKFILDSKIEEIDKKIGEFKILYKETLITFTSLLENYKNWHLRQIVLPTESSIVRIETEEKGFQIYLNSSYILPIDYKGLKEKWNNSYTQAKGSFRSLSNRVTIDLQTDFFTRNYQKELESRELRAVQVLAMFISVATLILGTVKIFENRGLIPSLIILIGFGTVLITFNYFFYWFTKRNNQDYFQKFTYTDVVTKKWVLSMKPFYIGKIPIENTLRYLEGKDYMEKKLRTLIYWFVGSLSLGILFFAILAIVNPSLAEKLDIVHIERNTLKKEILDSIHNDTQRLNSKTNLKYSADSLVEKIKNDPILKNKLKKALK